MVLHQIIILESENSIFFNLGLYIHKDIQNKCSGVGMSKVLKSSLDLRHFLILYKGENAFLTIFFEMGFIHEMPLRHSSMH